jgi:site-specific recombinase XerD
MKTYDNFPSLLEAFFTDRLMRQRQASPHTLASYRDTFRLLLEYAERILRKPPSAVTLDDLSAPFVGEFLNHLEKERRIAPRSRNLRLSAIRSFFRYAAFQQPDRSALIQRVLAIPSKRYDRAQVAFLSRPEIDAILAAPDVRERGGRRDHALLMLAVQTGLRVSELTGLRSEDLKLGAGAHVRCRGKGRKERCTPLTKQGACVLKAWLRERGGSPSDPVFPNARGGPLSADGVEYILAKHVATARESCPTLQRKRVSPHVLRHSTAMFLRQSGVDLSVIALWLGHESVETTQIYLDADLALKERIIDKTPPANGRRGRYKPKDRLLAFLKGM